MSQKFSMRWTILDWKPCKCLVSTLRIFVSGCTRQLWHGHLVSQISMEVHRRNVRVSLFICLICFHKMQVVLFDNNRLIHLCTVAGLRNYVVCYRKTTSEWALLVNVCAFNRFTSNLVNIWPSKHIDKISNQI